MDSEAVATVPQPEVAKPQNEISMIRDRLQESKQIAQAARVAWKEIADSKRQADARVTAMSNDGYGVPSQRELDGIKAAKWSSMESHVVAIKKFIDVANGSVDTLDEMVHLSKVDFVAWMDRAIAELRAAMPGYSESTAKSHVGDMPQYREGHQLLQDTQRQVSAMRQLVKDALTAIEATESEMKTQSVKWRTV